MAERRVEGIRKDESGEILEICGSWGLSSVSDAISDIEAGTHQYYVEEAGVRTPVEVVEAEEGRRLRTVEDPTLDNHLGNLPGC